MPQWHNDSFNKKKNKIKIIQNKCKASSRKAGFGKVYSRDSLLSARGVLTRVLLGVSGIKKDV